MAVENTLIQIHKACELIIDFLDDNAGAVSLLGTVVTLGVAILASWLTFWFSRCSARADREQKFKDCRESFQKIFPNYIERTEEMIDTLNSERIRLSGENAEGPNTGSLASGKLLEGVGVQLKLITNLPFTGFFSYPEVVEAYTDKSHKSKLSHVRKTELIHGIFGSFENVYTTQLDFRNLHNDSQKERIERMESYDLCLQEVQRSLDILGNKSESIQELIQSLNAELGSEFSKLSTDYGRVNDILKIFREKLNFRKKLFNSAPNPDREGVGKEHQAQLNDEKFFEAVSSLSDTITSHDIAFHSVMAIEKQILANFGNTHNSLEQHLKHLELNFQELSGEQNGNN